MSRIMTSMVLCVNLHQLHLHSGISTNWTDGNNQLNSALNIGIHQLHSKFYYTNEEFWVYLNVSFCLIKFTLAQCH